MLQQQQQQQQSRNLSHGHAARTSVNSPSCYASPPPPVAAVDAVATAPPTPNGNLNGAASSTPLQFMNLLKQSENATQNYRQQKKLGLDTNIFGVNPPSILRTGSTQEAAPTSAAAARKWTRADRKHRDLELKFALAVCCAQLPTAALSSAPFRDFIESAQPRFSLPSSVQPLERHLDACRGRIVASLSAQLAALPRFALILEAMSVDATARALCVSAAFYSSATQRVEAALLGVRRFCGGATPDEIRSLVAEVRNLVCARE